MKRVLLGLVGCAALVFAITSNPVGASDDVRSHRPDESEQFCPSYIESPLYRDRVNSQITVGPNDDWESAIEGAKSGTEILLRDGQYNMASGYMFLETNDITIRGASGNRDAVVVKGPGYGSQGQGFMLAGQGVTLADMTITEFRNHGISIKPELGAHSTNVYNVHLVDIGTQHIKGSAGGSDANGVVACSSIGYTDGGAVGDYNGAIDIHGAIDWTIRDNYIYNIAGDGTGCVVDDTAGFCGYESAPAIYLWRDSKGGVIERNVIADSFRGISLGLDSRHVGGVVRNNIIYRDESGRAGIELRLVENTTIENNTVILTDGYRGAIKYLESSDIIIRNNVLSAEPWDLGQNASITVEDNKTNATSEDLINLDLVTEPSMKIDAPSNPPTTNPVPGQDPESETLVVLPETAELSTTTTSKVAEVPAESKVAEVPAESKVAEVPAESSAVTAPTKTTVVSAESPSVDRSKKRTTAKRAYRRAAHRKKAEQKARRENRRRQRANKGDSYVDDSVTAPASSSKTPPTTVDSSTTKQASTPTSTSIPTSVKSEAKSATSDPAELEAKTVTPTEVEPQAKAATSDPVSPGAITVTPTPTTVGPQAKVATSGPAEAQAKPSTAQQTEPSASGGLLTENDFSYLGAFEAPSGLGDSGFAYGGSASTFNPYGDTSSSDGYDGSLFLTGFAINERVAEISIPAPVRHNGTRENLPVAKVLQPLADITGGRGTSHIGSLAQGGIDDYRIGGLEVIDGPGGPRLHWSAWQYYNVSYNDVAGHGHSSLNLSQPDTQGPWYLGDFKTYATAGYLFSVPPAFADQHLSGRSLIAGWQDNAGSSYTSWGPPFFAFDPPLTASPETRIPVTELANYNYPNEKLAGYEQPSRKPGADWVSTTDGRQAIVIVGNQAGTTRYGLPDPGDCSAYKGYHGDPYNPEFSFYDPMDLAKVAAGEMEPSQVKPYRKWNPADLLIPTCEWRLSSISFDEVNNLIYVVQIGGVGKDDETAPIVHVFKVS